jgi:hypothetical protein
MKEHICTSREMAERLKEAGYNGPALWGYGAQTNDAYTIYEAREGGFKIEIKAPTATELMPKGWVLGNLYDGWNISGSGPTFIHENPHDAAAMAWLWEEENGQ